MSMNTITIPVSISPVSSRDESGGTVRCRVPLTCPDSGDPRTLRELRAAAIERAVQRLYGRGCFWWADSGLRGYGQVMRPCRTGGSSAVTYRASLDVDMPTLPAAHIAALEARAEEERALYEQMERDYQAGLADGRSGGAPGRTRSDATFDYERGYRDGVAMRADIDDLEG